MWWFWVDVRWVEGLGLLVTWWKDKTNWIMFGRTQTINLDKILQRPLNTHLVLFWT